MTCCTSKIYESPLSQNKNGMSIGEKIFVDLGFDIDFFNPFIFVQIVDLYFIIEVTNITYYRLIFHFEHVFEGNNILIICVCNKDITFIKRILYVFYFKACLLYTSPSPRDGLLSRMPSS